MTTTGDNGAWTVHGWGVQAAAGVMTVIASDKLFCLGGASSTNDTTFEQIIPSGNDASFDDTGMLENLNSTSSSLLADRALGVGLQGAGFIYYVGGTSDGIDAIATTERTF